MKVFLAKTAGFCFGVNNALETVFRLLKNNERPIYTLGPIIHNEQMVNYLEGLGVVTINNINDISDTKADLVIRAHGISPYVYEQLKEKNNLSIIDSTCPYVKKIHKLVKEKYDLGYEIIIVGDEKHPEVIGINGECENKAIIINNINDFYKLQNVCEKVCVVSQTTFNYAKWEGIISAIKEKYNNSEFFDTICSSTSVRQKEAEEIAKNVDMMIVIGGKNSSNTNKLYEICKTYCNETYQIEIPGELPPVNINKIKKIGITAGASTPDWIIKEVLRKMEELNRQEQEQEQVQVQKQVQEQVQEQAQEQVQEQAQIQAQEQEQNQEPEQEMSFAEALEGSLVTIRSGHVVKGTVFKITNDSVIVDLGCKYEGTISMDELSDDPFYKPEENLKIGQEIDVLVLRVIDSEAIVILSKKRVDVIRGWDILDEAFKNMTPIKAKVSEVVNGGVMAIAHGIKLFVPASQISDRYIKDLNDFLRQIITVRIIDFNRGKKKVVGSQRIIMEEKKALLSGEVWNSIEVGKTYNGKVKSFTNFGAFVDIGGVDGLIHLSEISWKRIKHPSEVFKIGDEVEVTILDFNKEKHRISLGYRKLEDNPWNNIAQKYYVGDIVHGKEVRLVPFGCFVQLDDSIDALVHISQISNKRIAKPDDVLKVGQEIDAKIIEMDLENKKIGLSIKEVNPIDPVAEDKVTKDAQTSDPAEKIPTEHKEELSMKIGEVLKDIDIEK